MQISLTLLYSSLETYNRKAHRSSNIAAAGHHKMASFQGIERWTNAKEKENRTGVSRKDTSNFQVKTDLPKIPRRHSQAFANEQETKNLRKSETEI